MEALTDILKFWATLLFDWPIGTIMAVFCLGILIGLLYIIGNIFFYILDSSFRPRLRCLGQVNQKNYTPEETTLSFNAATETVMTQTTPASYRLLVWTDDGYAWKSVGSGFYNSVSIGSSINVRYCTGRFSNKVYIQRLGG